MQSHKKRVGTSGGRRRPRTVVIFSQPSWICKHTQRQRDGDALAPPRWADDSVMDVRTRPNSCLPIKDLSFRAFSGPPPTAPIPARIVREWFSWFVHHFQRQTKSLPPPRQRSWFVFIGVYDGIKWVLSHARWARKHARVSECRAAEVRFGR